MQIAPASSGKIVVETIDVGYVTHEIKFIEGGSLPGDSTLELNDDMLMILPVDAGTSQNPIPIELSGMQNPPDKQSYNE